MMTNDAMACRELVELVTEYLEDALEPIERARFDEHILECSDCRAYLEQFRQTIKLVGNLGEQPISPYARNELLHVFRTWRQT
jgi:predicted anti-sigma-YlaC factor YlaD